MERVLNEYWQQGLQQQAVAALTAEKLKSHWQIISSQECRNGKIDDQHALESLLEQGATMVIAPCYARKHDDYFLPYLLIVQLEATGKFSPNLACALPIIPKAVLEPSDASPICMGFFDNFESYFIMNGPEWAEDPALLTWQHNLHYAEQMLQDVTSGLWRQHAQDAGFVIQDSALIFPMAVIYQAATMDISILAQPQKIELIDAEPHSGKSAYAKSLIIDAWMTAAIKQAPPPEYVWLRYEQPVNYISIFDLASSEKLSSKSMQEIHSQLIASYNSYVKGKQAVHNWQQIIDRLQNKYADRGGIYARIAQLQDSLKEAHTHNRHIQVLHSIWLRQLELLTTWNRFFDFIPILQKRRLHRLYVFFKQNFSGEKVNGLNQNKLEELLLDKLRRATNSERFIADALHQTENDLRQEEVIQDKCLDWAKTQNDQLIVNLDTIKQILNSAWDNLVNKTLDYWLANFSVNYGHANFLSRRPDKIDLLIVEHAEYVAPMQAAELLAITKRAVIMGNYNPICNPRFSVQADYELTRYFELATSDADFEDLQFDGKLASLGNLWNLAMQGNEASKAFNRQTELQLHYEYKNIFAVSEEHSGSRLNLAEVNGILNWLANNASLIDNVAIYTSFSAQARQLRERLKSSPYARVPVRMLQEPCFSPKAISIFSPVYTANDAGPYVFDRGLEILENLKNNTTQRIVVIGDVSIFKPELHSASGKFAKLLINKTKIQEVDCV